MVHHPAAGLLGAPPDAMASKAHSGDSRCVAHHMNDDPIAADLQEDRTRACASAATRDVLDARTRQSCATSLPATNSNTRGTAP